MKEQIERLNELCQEKEHDNERTKEIKKYILAKLALAALLLGACGREHTVYVDVPRETITMPDNATLVEVLCVDKEGKPRTGNAYTFDNETIYLDKELNEDVTACAITRTLERGE